MGHGAETVMLVEFGSDAQRLCKLRRQHAHCQSYPSRETPLFCDPDVSRKSHPRQKRCLATLRKF